MKPLIAIALGILTPSQVHACRIGYDQHLFEESPPPDALADVEIVRVRFSNARAGIENWPRGAVGPDSSVLGYTLIGIAQRFDEDALSTEAFPVYAFVTSCSAFWPMALGDEYNVVEGDYYLIGRFSSDEGQHRYYAGGRRVLGSDVNSGWHY